MLWVSSESPRARDTDGSLNEQVEDSFQRDIRHSPSESEEVLEDASDESLGFTHSCARRRSLRTCLT